MAQFIGLGILVLMLSAVISCPNELTLALFVGALVAFLRS